MTSAKKWMWITLLATLLLGVGLGVLVDRFVIVPTVLSSGSDHRARWQDHRSHFLGELQKELALTPEQSREIERVLEGNHETARKFWAESREQFDALRQQLRNELREVLNEEQAARFDALLAERNARRKVRNGREDD
jgi:hypothetical protein